MRELILHVFFNFTETYFRELEFHCDFSIQRFRYLLREHRFHEKVPSGENILVNPQKNRFTGKVGTTRFFDYLPSMSGDLDNGNKTKCEDIDELVRATFPKPFRFSIFFLEYVLNTLGWNSYRDIPLLVPWQRRIWDL